MRRAVLPPSLQGRDPRRNGYIRRVPTHHRGCAVPTVYSALATCYARSVDSEYWGRYYAVTADRPSWDTVKLAIALFAADKEAASRPRFAVDLGCGAGRDARELLRAGWRVLAVDRERGAIQVLEAATPPELRPALETRVAAKLFGDHDDSSADPAMTCPPPQRIRESLSSFEIEHWLDSEEDTQTALGEPHHFHLVEVVARRAK